MKAMLLRVRIDTGTDGTLGPVFADGTFEYCVFRDSPFADDVAKTNLSAILEQHGLSNVRSL